MNVVINFKAAEYFPWIIYIYIYIYILSVNVVVRVSTGIVFLDRTLLPAPVASGWKVLEELTAWTPAGANSVFFKRTGMRDRRFFCGSLARQKEVSTWILLNWFDLNHHFCGVFPFWGHLRVYLFCFSFHVGECMLVFTLNTCANIDIHPHQFETRVSFLAPVAAVTLSLLYHSSILDIEHSPYYIALGSTHNHNVICGRPTLFVYIYIYIYKFRWI